MQLAQTFCTLFKSSVWVSSFVAFYILSANIFFSNITFSFNVFTENEFHTYNFIEYVSLSLSIEFSFLFLVLDTVY